MAKLQKIVIGSRGRLAQLIPGCGNNQQARASDVNEVIEFVNDIAATVDSSPTPVAINATKTMSPTEMASGWITSTSAAGTTMTTCTVAQLVTALQITPATGDTFELVIDNSAGASTVTVALGTGFAVLPTLVITGTDTLTIATLCVGAFKIIFTSATTASIVRIF